jgi:hypothetical protein
MHIAPHTGDRLLAMSIQGHLQVLTTAGARAGGAVPREAQRAARQACLLAGRVAYGHVGDSAAIVTSRVRKRRKIIEVES